METAAEKRSAGEKRPCPGRRKMRQKMRRKQKNSRAESGSEKEQTSAEQPAEQKTDTVEKQMPQRNAEKTQKAPDQTEKTAEGDSTEGAARARAGTGCAEKSILERFFGRIEYLPEKLLNLVSRLLQTAFRLLELPFRLLEKLEQKIQAGRRLKKKVGECEKNSSVRRCSVRHCSMQRKKCFIS